jgi:hypothetical protein
MGDEDLSRGLAGGLGGGLTGAATAGVALGFEHFSVFLAMALGYGIAAASFSRIFPALVAAFSGVAASAFVTDPTILHQFSQTRGLAAVFTNGVGFGLTVGIAVALARRRDPLWACDGQLLECYAESLLASFSE